MDSDLPFIAPYSLLIARGVGVRADEALHAGIVLHAPAGPLVALTPDHRRLRSVHPDFGAIDTEAWASTLQASLFAHGATGNVAQAHALLSLLAHPFDVAAEFGSATIDESPEETLEQLVRWLVTTPMASTGQERPLAASSSAPPDLIGEIRAWLKSAHIFSRDVREIRHGKVVSNFPINVRASLFADFAVMNGALNAIETLDLRGVARLTPTLRGRAALKAITLDEAKDHVDGRRLLVTTADDYGLAAPMISMASRYADDCFDLQEPDGRQRLADFIAMALHRSSLPELPIQGIDRAQQVRGPLLT